MDYPDKNSFNVTVHDAELTDDEIENIRRKLEELAQQFVSIYAGAYAIASHDEQA